MTILPKNIENYIRKSFPDKRMQTAVIWIMFSAFIGLLFIVRPAFASVSSFLGYPESTKETYTYILSGISARRTLDMCFSQENIDAVSKVGVVQNVLWLASIVGIVMIFVNVLAKVMEMITQANMTTDRLMGLLGGMIIPIILIININMIIDGVNAAGAFAKDELEKYSTTAEETANPYKDKPLPTAGSYGDYLKQFGGIDENILIDIETFDDFLYYLINTVDGSAQSYQKAMEVYKDMEEAAKKNPFLANLYKSQTDPTYYYMETGLNILEENGFNKTAYLKDLETDVYGLVDSYKRVINGDIDGATSIMTNIDNSAVSGWNYMLNNMTNEEYTIYYTEGFYSHIQKIINQDITPEAGGFGRGAVDGYVGALEKDAEKIRNGNAAYILKGLWDATGGGIWNALTGGVESTATNLANKAVKLVLELIIIFADIGVRIGIVAACFGVFGRLIIYQMFLPIGIADIATEGIRSNGLRMIKLFFAVYLEMGLFFVVNRLGWFIFKLLTLQVTSTASLLVCFVAGGVGIRAMMKSCKAISERVMGV